MVVELFSVHYTANVSIYYNCEIASKIFSTLFPINPLSTSKKCAFCTSGVKLTPGMIFILELFLLYFFQLLLT